MTYAQFNDSSPWQRIQFVFAEGTYLAERSKRGFSIDIFHLPDGYFVEFFYRQSTRSLIAIRSLCNRTALVPYAAGIQLPELLN